MRLNGSSALVTGGASGLGLATAKRLLENGADGVVLVDLPTSDGELAAKELGDRVSFVPADVRNTVQMNLAIEVAVGMAPMRAVVHCAGRAVRCAW